MKMDELLDEENGKGKRRNHHDLDISNENRKVYHGRSGDDRQVKRRFLVPFCN
jgi:hypothetical protein